MATPLWAKFTLPLACLSTWILMSIFPTGSLTFYCSLYLPMYMVHQFEEHYGDRFKFFTNTIVMKSPNPEYPLESLNILLINVGYVWALFSMVIITALFDPFVIVLLPIVSAMNGAGHIISYLQLKMYNPGLLTSIFCFWGLFLYILPILFRARIPAGYFVLSTLIGFLVHLQIMTHMKAKAEAAITKNNKKLD